MLIKNSWTAKRVTRRLKASASISANLDNPFVLCIELWCNTRQRLTRSPGGTLETLRSSSGASRPNGGGGTQLDPNRERHLRRRLEQPVARVLRDPPRGERQRVQTLHGE